MIVANQEYGTLPYRLRDATVPVAACTLDSLPVELLLAITSWLDCDGLLNAALASRRMHDIAIGHLYRNVFYIQLTGREGEGGPDNHLGCGLPDPQNTHLPLIPRGTRIFDIDGFYETMSDSKPLRQKVLGASFCWHAEPDTADDLLLRELYTLLVPTAKFFHLSPPPHVGKTFIEYPVTSLQIDDQQMYSIDVPPAFQDKSIYDLGASRQRLYTVFANPTLKRLSLEEIYSWDSWRLSPVSTWRGTSNIVHLAIPISGFPDEGLVEVLGWPRALRSFSFSLRWVRPSLIAPILADALWQQRSSLEFIDMSEGVTFSLADAVSVSRGLNEYPRLTGLALPSQAFTQSRYGGEEAAMERALFGLPPSLQELQIQLNGVWEKDTRHSELLPPWLRSLAARKPTFTPQLRLVILYAPKASKAPLDPELGDEWLKTREVMLKVGIALRWSNGDHSPLNDARLPEPEADLTEGHKEWRIWDAYGIPRHPPPVV